MASGVRPLTVVRAGVVHTTEGGELPSSAEGLAQFCTQPKTSNNLASYHAVADTDASIIPLAPYEKVPFANAGANTDTVSIVQPGRSAQTREQWFDPNSQGMMEGVARWIADTSKQFNLPIKKLTWQELRAGGRGFVNHWDVSLAYERSTHTDCGPNYPWDWVIGRALELVHPEIPTFPPFDPRNRQYSLWPLAPSKPTISLGDAGDAVLYAQGVYHFEIRRFAAWFFATGAYGTDVNRGNWLNYVANLSVNGTGVYDADFHHAIWAMYNAFTDSAFENQQFGPLEPDRIGPRNWAFIDDSADQVWAD
jgi:hypothetical protein